MARLMVSVSGVRGIVGSDFHPLLVGQWTAAFASLLRDGAIVLGRDSRPSGELFGSVAAQVLRSCGREVWDLGIVPTPTVQVAVEAWGAAGGLILTASHNPSQWNAMKFVGHDGSFLSAAAFASLKEHVADRSGGFLPQEQWGSTTHRGPDALKAHRTRIMQHIDGQAIRRRGARILVDCVNGAGGVLLPELLRALGAEVTVLHGEPHGRFPRDPEPAGPPLQELASEALDARADFAVAVDPDADRCAVAIPDSEVVGEEWTLPLVALHVLQDRRGSVVTNLSTSTRLEAVAQRNGSRVERTPVGEAHVVARMREIGAVLGGEGNGGVIDPRIHYGRDAAVAAALLLEAHAKSPEGLKGLAKQIPPRYVGKAKLPLQEPGLTGGLAQALRDRFGEPQDLRDGLRWAFPDGFVHVRVSSTEPILRIVAERSSEQESRALIDSVLKLVALTDRG